MVSLQLTTDQIIEQPDNKLLRSRCLQSYRRFPTIQEVQPKFTQTLPVCLCRVVFLSYAITALLPFMQ